MSYDTIDALRESLARPTAKVRTPEYIAKMMHAVPKATVVDRHAFIVERCRGKRVLEFGASGTLTEKLRAAASEYFGVDRVGSADGRVQGFDLDDVTADGLPSWSQTDFVRLDMIVCGEVLEHLANPGYFLKRLRTQFFEHEQHGGVRAIISVPNAFASAAQLHMEDGIENVNIDHVCWYSYTTLKTLLERHGYVIDAFHWYNGEPLTAEGLIMVAH